MKLRKSEIPSYLFIFCLTIFYTCNWVGHELDMIMLCGLFWGIVAIAMNLKFGIKELLFLFIISALVIAKYVKSVDNQLPVLLIILFLGRKLDSAKVIRLMFYTKLFCVITGLIFEGYGKNTIAVQSMVLILLYICKTGEQAEWKKVSGVAAAYLGIALYTNTGAFIVVGGISILLWITLKIKRIQRICTSIYVIWIAPICLFLNYFFAACVNEVMIPFVGQYLPDWLNYAMVQMAHFLDVAMSMRLSLTKSSIVHFGVSLWGGNVDAETLRAQSGGYFYLDSGLFNLLQGGGIVLAVLFLGLYTITMYYLVKKEQFCYIIAGIAIPLYAISEPVLLSFGTDFLILFMGSAIYYLLYRKVKSEAA